MMSTQREAFSKSVKDYFENEHGILAQLGIQCTHTGYSNVVAHMPYDANFTQNHHDGLAFGVITIGLDSLFGLCVLLKAQNLSPIATIDLKIDHILKPTEVADITLEADCYALTNGVAFVRGHATQTDSNKLLVSASGTFMVGTGGPSFAVNIQAS